MPHGRDRRADGGPLLRYAAAIGGARDGERGDARFTLRAPAHGDLQLAREDRRNGTLADDLGHGGVHRLLHRGVGIGLAPAPRGMVVRVERERVSGARRLLAVVGAVLGRVLQDVANLQRRERGVGLQDQRAQSCDGRRRHARAVDVVVAGAVRGGIAQRRDDVRTRTAHRWLHLVEVVRVAVREAWPLVRVAGYDVVPVRNAVSVLEGADRDVEVGRGRARHVGRLTVVAGGDAHDDAGEGRGVHGGAIRIAPVGGGRPAKAHVDDLDAAIRHAQRINAPYRVAVRDAPFERFGRAATDAGIRQCFAVREPRVGSHAGIGPRRRSRRQDTGGAAAADRRSRDVRAVVRAFGVRRVRRVRARIGRRVQRRVRVGKVAAAHELPPEGLVTRVGVARGIIHSRVDDPDDFAAPGDAEIAPRRRKHARVRSARGLPCPQRACRDVVGGIHHLPRFDFTDAGKPGDGLDLGKGGPCAQVRNVTRPPQQLGAGVRHCRHVEIRGGVVVAHVDTIGQRVGVRVNEQDQPAAQHVASVRGSKAVRVDGLNAVVNAILVRVPQVGVGGGRRGHGQREREQRGSKHSSKRHIEWSPNWNGGRFAPGLHGHGGPVKPRELLTR